MSVTVADCLKLPSLREATLVAGAQGLNRTVSAVSVIEYPNIVAMSDELLVGNELLISALVQIKDDIGAQCRLVRHLYNMGEACLVLYYVGTHIQEVSKQLISVANELGFPLIVMPTGRLDFRYGEAIAEVTELVLSHSRKGSYYVSEMANQIANLPIKNRTMSSVLRLLSDRLHCTLLITDRYMEHKSVAAWPIANQWDYEQILQMLMKKKYQSGMPIPCVLNERNFTVWEYPVHSKKKKELHLFIIEEHGNALPELLSQAAEVVELFLNVWNKDINYEETEALVHAILSDQPEEMRRIASRMRIDIGAIQTILIFRLYKEDGQSLDHYQRANYIMPMKNFLLRYYKMVIVDTYDKYMVVLCAGKIFEETDTVLLESLKERLENEGLGSSYIACLNVENTAQARAYYIMADEIFEYIRKVYPYKHVFDQSEIQFVKSCLTILESGEELLTQKLLPLKKLENLSDCEELIRTLCVFLLDADSSTHRAAELLFVHRNTVHYRLGKIRTVLNCDLVQMPAVFEIYQAAALYRLMTTNNN